MLALMSTPLPATRLVMWQVKLPLNDQPADGIEHEATQLSDCRQGQGGKPLQVGGEGDEEDKVVEEVGDDHVAGHVQLGNDQPLQLACEGGLLPPVCGEEVVDGDADGKEAGKGGHHRDHCSRTRKVQQINPDRPLQTPGNIFWSFIKIFKTNQTKIRIPLQTVKVQRKVERARIDSTRSQVPAKERVVKATRLVITVPHLSIHLFDRLLKVTLKLDNNHCPTFEHYTRQNVLTMCRGG